MNPAPCVAIDGPMSRAEVRDGCLRVFESWGGDYALWVDMRWFFFHTS